MGFDERMKVQMEAELTRVCSWVAVLRAEFEADTLESIADNTPLSEVMESIQASEDRELRMELLARLVKRSAAIEAALERIENGDYGICTGCGEPIHRQRLEALPEVEVCLGCQARTELAREGERNDVSEWLDAANLCDFPGCRAPLH